MKIKIPLAILLAGLELPLQAASLSESTFTEVINDVNVVAATTKATTPAKVNELFKAPDVVRTGTDSRTELTAPDDTITRVGANTVFSFEPVGRSIRLEQGSILFHSPAGKGGGTIKTGGAVAAVLGTTIIVVATPDGGFKFIVLEGKGRATLPNGKTVTLTAGQLVFVLPGQNGFSPVLDINLDKLVSGSRLVNNFAHELPSLARVNAAIRKQNKAIAKGGAKDTGVTPKKILARARVGNGLNGVVDAGSYQNAAHQPLSAKQTFNFITKPGPGSNFPPVSLSPGGRGFVPLSF